MSDRLRSVVTWTTVPIPGGDMPDLTPDEWRLLEQWKHEKQRTDAVENDLPGLHAPRSRKKRPRPKQPESSAYAGIFFEHAPVSRGWYTPHVDQWAEQQALDWANLMFTLAEASAWLKAGIAFDEEEIASLLRKEGITPDHLSLVIRRTTVLDRLRVEHMSVRQIAALLRREGKLAS